MKYRWLRDRFSGYDVDGRKCKCETKTFGEVKCDETIAFLNATWISKTLKFGLSITNLF